MKIRWNTKYTTISAYSVITFVICLLVYLIIAHVGVIGGWIGTFFKVIAPMIWGVVIAYLLNPIMLWLEVPIAKLTGRKKPHPKLTRALTVTISLLLFIAALAALVAIIVPQLIDSVTKIVDNMSTYMNNLEKWLNSLLVNYPEVMDFIDGQFNDIKTALTQFRNEMVPKLGDIMVKIKDGALSVIVGLKDFLIGIIVAVYLMLDKEHFQAQLKKIISALFPEKATKSILRICDRTNSSLSGFISGKIIDSIIIGILCFICMTIMKLDYTLLISVIVGVTNIIPFFGPFFGAIPSALLLLMSSPKQVIPFIILIIAIQQLDGNVIGPKILGQTTGISAFWVMFAILVGGGLFGFAGMLLGVPIFAVIYSLTEEFINFLLERKGMSVNTADYAVAFTPRPSKKDNNKSQMKSFRLFRGNKEQKNTDTPSEENNNDNKE